MPLLSNRMLNRFDNRLYPVYKHSTGCQTHLTTGLTKRLYRVYSRLSIRLYNPVWQPNTGCSFNTVVKPVVQPVWQSIVSCKRGLTYHFSFLWVRHPIPWLGLCLWSPWSVGFYFYIKLVDSLDWNCKNCRIPASKNCNDIEVIYDCYNTTGEEINCFVNLITVLYFHVLNTG